MEEWKRGSNTWHLLREDQGASTEESVHKQGEERELKLCSGPHDNDLGGHGEDIVGNRSRLQTA